MNRPTRLLCLALTLWAAHAAMPRTARADFVTPILLPDHDGSPGPSSSFSVEVVYPTPITIEFFTPVVTSSATGMATRGINTKEWNGVQFTFHDPGNAVSFTMDFDMFTDAESGGLGLGAIGPGGFQFPVDARSIAYGVASSSPITFVAPIAFISVGPIVVTTRRDPGPRPDVAVPEPAGIVLMGLGGIGIAGVAWKRQRRRTGAQLWKFHS